MTKIKKLLVVLPVSVLLLGLVAMPVYAHEGEDSQSLGTSSATELSEPTDRMQPTSQSGHRTEEELRHKGQELLKQAKEQKQRKEAGSAAQDDSSKSEATLKQRREKRCENRKHGLETKIANIVTVAQKHESRIDDIYTKALAYQKDKDITVEDFDSLVASANSAKAQAQVSVEALSSLKPAIQCTSDTVATDVATFKAAAEQARTDLKTYRTSVKAILTALKDAKEN